MYEKIWYEFVHYRSGDFYLVLYIKRLKTIRKTVNISTLLLSTTGILSWKIWLYLPAVSSSIIAIMQLFRLIENQIIPSDKDIEQVIKLREMYYDHWNNLEKLFIDLKSEKINETKAKDSFFKLREKSKDIKSFNNKITIKEIKSLQNKSDIKTNDYLNQYHL